MTEQKNEEKKKYRVAVLKGARIYHGEYDSGEWVAQLLSEFYEVEEEDYKALQLYCSQYDFRLIEPVPVPDVLGDARKVWVQAQAERKRYEAEAEKRKKKAAEERKKKAVKLIEKKKAELVKLAEEAGLVLVPKT